MISLFFRCRYQSDSKLHQVEALQRDIWKKCDKRGLGGFLVQQGSGLIGMIEGDQRASFNCVEAIIRKPAVTAIEVITEKDVEKCGWAYWTSGAYNVEELLALDVPHAPDLAKLLANPVDAS